MTTVEFEMKCQGCMRILRGSLKVQSPNFKTHKDLFCWFPDCKKQNDFKKEYIVWPPHSREHSHFDIINTNGAPK